MVDDARKTERVRQASVEANDDQPRGGNGHSADLSIRTAFLERAAAAVGRLAESVDERRLQVALEADTDRAILDVLGLTRNAVEYGFAAATDPLARARARGEQAKRDILVSQGEMLDAPAVARRLGIDAPQVEQRRRDGMLLALPIESEKLGFPAWQFTENGVLPGLEEVFQSMSVRSPWMRAAFFLSGDLRLNGRTPLETLLHGEIDAVRRAGAAYGEQLAS